MTDFNTMIKALKVAWIPSLQSRTDASWKIIGLRLLCRISEECHLWHCCNYDVDSLQINNLPVFYRELCWNICKIQNTPFEMILSPHKELIWNNRNIMIDGKPFFFLTVGLKTILQDLIDNNGNVWSFNQFSEQYQLKTLSPSILD